MHRANRPARSLVASRTLTWPQRASLRHRQSGRPKRRHCPGSPDMSTSTADPGTSTSTCASHRAALTGCTNRLGHTLPSSLDRGCSVEDVPRSRCGDQRAR
eukprot:364518-Chlamydomonas_euryale.AAC.5